MHTIYPLLKATLLLLLLVVGFTRAAIGSNDCLIDEEKVTRDLTCWDANQPLTLAGSWQILTGFAPDDIDLTLLNHHAWQTANIHTTWKQLGASDQNVASYRLNLKLKRETRGLYLFPGEGFSSLRVFVSDQNTEFIQVFRNISPQDFKDKKAGILGDRIVALPPLPVNATLILQVSNGPFVDGMIFRAPIIANKTPLLSALDINAFWGILAAGGFIALALVNFSLWLARKQDIAQLFLGLLFFIMAIRLFDTARLINIVSPDSEVVWLWRLGWYTFFGLLISWSLFFHAAFTQYSSKRLTVFITTTTLLFIITSLFMGDKFLQQVGEWFRLLALVVIIISIRGTYLFIKDNKGQRLPLIIGAIILPTCGFIDMVSQINGHYLNTTNGGFFIFGLLITAYLNRRYISALNESEALTKSLEQRVTEKTQELSVLADKANAANRAKSDFLANMTHEIRTPFNGIFGTLQLLQQNDQRADRKTLISNAILSSKMLMTIINDILDLSKIEAKKLELEKIDFKLEDIIKIVVSDITPTAEAKHTSITVHYANDYQEGWHGDPVRIKQILLNIVSNAVKFTEHGQVNIHISCTNQTQPSELCIRVTDTGMGMTQAALDRVFDRFVQADSSTTRHHGGTGLGLAITNQLIKLMDGKIDVNSEQHKGTTFIVTLPLSKVDVTDLETDSSELKELDLTDIDILLAEDNPINQTVFESMLSSSHANIRIAADGYQAVTMTKERQPHIIFMDIQMPNMDGYESTQLIKAQYPHIPIIALTANLVGNDIQHFIDKGFDSALSKPYEISDLYKTIQQFL